MATKKISITPNQRGFANGKFVDRYGISCSIQMSSLATEDCIWLGVDDVKPEIMASQARAMGLEVPEGVAGWVPFLIPDEVVLHDRMHLTREMVADLLPILQHFVKTGDLKMNPEPRVYCTTFCNMGHRLKDGVPVGHECFVLRPDLLARERDGETIDPAVSMLAANRGTHKGVKR